MIVMGDPNAELGSILGTSKCPDLSTTRTTTTTPLPATILLLPQHNIYILRSCWLSVFRFQFSLEWNCVTWKPILAYSHLPALAGRFNTGNIRFFKEIWVPGLFVENIIGATWVSDAFNILEIFEPRPSLSSPDSLYMTADIYDCSRY